MAKLHQNDAARILYDALKGRDCPRDGGWRQVLADFKCCEPQSVSNMIQRSRDFERKLSKQKPQLSK